VINFKWGGMMKKENLIKDRSFDFAVKVLRYCRQLRACNDFVIARQLQKSGTSIGANVQEADAAKSKAVFLLKMSISSKEARETQYWLRLIQSSDIHVHDTDILTNEASEPALIFSRIVKTTYKNIQKSKKTRGSKRETTI
jgi:four helix bundle protein